jgi:hypothetical protein
MLLPNFIYGKNKEVEKRCEKLGKTVTSCQEYLEKMLSSGMRDTSADAGELLVLHGPSPMLSKVTCYQLYCPLDMIWRKHEPGLASSQMISDIFQESLKTAWGTLLLTPPLGRFWMQDDARRRAYVRALFAHWEEIDPLGPRFSFGGHTGEPLLSLPTMIQTAIGLVRGMSSAEAARADWPTFFHELRSKGDI